MALAARRLRPVDAVLLRESCAGNLAHHKIPRWLHVVDKLPMAMSGKVRSVEMRDEDPSLSRLSKD